MEAGCVWTGCCGCARESSDGDGEWVVSATSCFSLIPPPQTLFSIASNSKLFTAIAAGLMVANESTTRGSGARLKPTTKIKDVVPSWGLMDPVASDGTDLIDLLCGYFNE